MGGSHFFLLFPAVRHSAMAVNLAKDFSNDKDRITGHGSRRHSRPSHRVKNSESCIAEPGIAGMRPARKGQAKTVDEVTDFLDRIFCHSRAEAPRQVRARFAGDQPGARELTDAFFFLWRCFANNVN
jgi:hypothetical protein